MIAPIKKKHYCSDCLHFAAQRKKGRDWSRDQRRLNDPVELEKRRAWAAKKARPCSGCRSLFEVSEGTWHKHKKLCHACRPAKAQAARYEPPTWIATRISSCAWCDTTFLGSGKYCSDQCRTEANGRSTRISRGTPLLALRYCECGSRIEKGRQRCLSCSEALAKAARQRKKRAEKARKRGIQRDPYTIQQIAQRDELTCGLCRKAVDMTLCVPHQKAPTIDHIVPISLGGQDTLDNVQLAHFGCNARKGANRLC